MSLFCSRWWSRRLAIVSIVSFYCYRWYIVYVAACTQEMCVIEQRVCRSTYVKAIFKLPVALVYSYARWFGYYFVYVTIYFQFDEVCFFFLDLAGYEERMHFGLVPQMNCMYWLTQRISAFPYFPLKIVIFETYCFPIFGSNGNHPPWFEYLKWREDFQCRVHAHTHSMGIYGKIRSFYSFRTVFLQCTTINLFSRFHDSQFYQNNYCVRARTIFVYNEKCLATAIPH